jgi:hypothetical protein
MLQGTSPDALLYSPAPHAEHVPPSGPCQPALQVQLLKAVLCGGELESAGQLLQSPAFPKKPALHWHAVKAVL